MTAVATPRPGSYTKGAMVPKMKMGARVTEEELELLKAAATAKALASGQDAKQESNKRKSGAEAVDAPRKKIDKLDSKVFVAIAPPEGQMSSVAAVTGELSEDGQCDEKELDKKLDAIASGSGSVYLNEKMMDVGEGRIRLLRNVPNPEACQALRGMKDHLDSKELVATAPPGGQMTAVATSRPGS